MALHQRMFLKRVCSVVRNSFFRERVINTTRISLRCYSENTLRINYLLKDLSDMSPNLQVRHSVTHVAILVWK